MKKCPACSETKAATEFYRDKHQPGGLSSCCKPCHRLRQRGYQHAARLEPAKHRRRLASHRKYAKSPKGREAAQRARSRWAAKQSTKEKQ